MVEVDSLVFGHFAVVVIAVRCEANHAVRLLHSAADFYGHLPG